MSRISSHTAIQSYSAGISKAGAIKLSSNESPFPPSDAVQKAMINAIQNAHIYPDLEHIELKKTIAHRHKVAASNIILGNGSGEILSFIAQLILTPHSEVIISTNTFSLYTITSSLAGASIKKVALVDGYCNLEEIHHAITSRTSVIFLPNPNNPTGTAYKKETMLSFLKTLPPHVYIVLDEAYMDFSESEYHIDPQQIFDVHERSIILRTFSKLFALGGLRLGYGISTAEIIQCIAQAKLPFTVNRAVAAGASVAMSESEHLKKNCNYIKTERDYLASMYQKIGVIFFNTQANFFCIALDDKTNNSHKAPADRAFDFFADNNIMIRALTSFDMPNHIRITIGKKEHNQLVCATLETFIKNI